MTETKKEEVKGEEGATVPAIPPPVLSPRDKLVQSVKRLERMLKHPSSTYTTDKSETDASSSFPNSTTDAVIEAATTLIHANPSKMVKRWMAESSGAAAKATLADISFVAKTLLDPNGTVGVSRSLLIELSPIQEDADITSEMDTTADADAGVDADADAKEEEKIVYLSSAVREVESYLLSLAVRLLWRQNDISRASDLVVKSIDITSQHMKEASKNTYGIGSANGLYPLLARLYRYQNLVMESSSKKEGSVEVLERGDLVGAHRMAVVRRDVDTQATLLNIMLRDLLQANQGTSPRHIC